MIPHLVRRRSFVAVLGWLSFLAIGWAGLLVPSFLRQIESDLHQTDAGIGAYYLVGALGYGLGSLGGGFLTERFGRRTILVGGALLNAIGLVGQGALPSWLPFVLFGIARSVGSGILDGGANGLILDLYPEARGRALNVAHLFFALGALGAPFAVAGLTSAGIGWEETMRWSGLLSLPLALLLAVSDLADRRPSAAGTPATAGAGGRTPPETGPSRILTLPILLLGIGIGCYMTNEVGVSSWLVRFLADAPTATATAALGLYWTGLTAGRLGASWVADRVDHLALTLAATVGMSLAVAAAVLAPTLEWQIAFCTLAGVASGPIYPLIMAIAGERFPDRAAVVSGILSTAGVVGGLVYPPLMGLISVIVNLDIAMLGTAAIGFVAAAALVALGRLPARQVEGA